MVLIQRFYNRRMNARLRPRHQFSNQFFFVLPFFPLFRGDLWKNHKIFSPAIDGSWPFTYIEVLILLHRRISIRQPELSEIGYSRATPEAHRWRTN